MGLASKYSPDERVVRKRLAARLRQRRCRERKRAAMLRKKRGDAEVPEEPTTKPVANKFEVNGDKKPVRSGGYNWGTQGHAAPGHHYYSMPPTAYHPSGMVPSHIVIPPAASRPHYMDPRHHHYHHYHAPTSSLKPQDVPSAASLPRRGSETSSLGSKKMDTSDSKDKATPSAEKIKKSSAWESKENNKKVQASSKELAAIHGMLSLAANASDEETASTASVTTVDETSSHSSVSMEASNVSSRDNMRVDCESSPGSARGAASKEPKSPVKPAAVVAYRQHPHGPPCYPPHPAWSYHHPAAAYASHVHHHPHRHPAYPFPPSQWPKHHAIRASVPKTAVTAPPNTVTARP